MIKGSPGEITDPNDVDELYLDHGLLIDVDPTCGKGINRYSYSDALKISTPQEVVAICKSIQARRLILPDWGLSLLHPKN